MFKKIVYYTFFTLFFLSIILPLLFTIFSVFFDEDSLIKTLNSFNFDLILLLINSIFIAATIAFSSTVIGIFLSFLLIKSRIRYLSFFKIALIIPLFIPPYILAVAWKDLFQLVFSNPNYLISYLGVIIVLTIIFTPLSLLIISSSLYNIDSGIEESGMMLTKQSTIIYRIIIPLIKPAIISSFVLVFIFSISQFSVPAIFGIRVFTTEIFTQFSAFYNHSLAIFQSFLLIIISVFLLFGERRYLSEAPFISIGSQGMKNNIKYQFNKTITIFALPFWFFVSIVLPFIILTIQSFKNGISDIIKAFEILVPTFINSFSISLIGAIIIVIVGFVAAVFAPSSKNKKTDYFNFMLLFVFAIPSSIFGISLIKFYNQPGLDFIYSGYAIIIIGYVGKFSFISAKLISNAIKQIPNSLFETADIIGIPYLKRVKKILIPIIRPTLFVAFIISFIFTFIELGTTIMVYPPGTELMPIKVFTIMANTSQALYSSMTLIVFLITLTIISIFYFIFNLLNKKHL